MGINDEYSRDAYLGDPYAYNSEDESVDSEPYPDPEDWQAAHSEDLLDAWAIIYEELQKNYMIHLVTYPKFVEFVLEPWKWQPQSAPRPFHGYLWRQISSIDAINKRASEYEFHGWAQHHLSELF